MSADVAQSRRAMFFVMGAACMLLFLSFGTRATFGLFLPPVSADLGWGREVFALAIAIQSIVVGAVQPFVSAYADRYGTGRTVVIGGLTYAAGLWVMAHASSPADAYLGLGVLVGLGLSGTSFAIVFAAVGRVTPERHRSFALGATGSIGSLGTFVMVPLGQGFIDAYGWSTVLLILSGTILVSLALAGVLRGRPAEQASQQSLGEALREARDHNGYRLLVCGFFVCGFHVAYVATHFPAYVTDKGLAPEYGAWALSLVGLFNIIGSFAAGFLGGKFSKRRILSYLYASRAVLFTAFVLLPTTEATVLIFGATMGLLWLSTVPVTSALVAQIFGARYMGTLFAIVFFSHQMGSFLGAWLGGYMFDLTGSYDMVWWIAVGLGVISAALHWPIDERPVARLRPAAVVTK
jgi:predicted MFS family arabinose efflux permease